MDRTVRMSNRTEFKMKENQTKLFTISLISKFEREIFLIKQSKINFLYFRVHSEYHNSINYFFFIIISIKYNNLK
jgi:hypothetical protein